MATSKNATSLARGLARVLSHRRWYAAYSAAALVSIQVGIGIVLKAAQTDNHYAFSPSSSVTISEYLKMLLAIGFFYREWAARVAENAGRAYLPVSASDDSVPLTHEAERRAEEDDEQHETGDEALRKTRPWVERSFLTAVRREVSTDIAFGLGLLSLFYVLINNLVFVSYQVADPATISLTKSGVTCVTALVLIFTLNTKVTGVQWLAIVLQVCGLFVTQYDPTAGGAYSVGVYLLLIFQVFLSAVSGVVNQGLLQASGASLHASNIILYGSGAWTNLLCHVIMRSTKPDEPGFFEGYGSLHAVLIIVNNVLIGLAMNAVYKCKCSAPWASVTGATESQRQSRRRRNREVSRNGHRHGHTHLSVAHILRDDFQPVDRPRIRSRVWRLVAIRHESESNTDEAQPERLACKHLPAPPLDAAASAAMSRSGLSASHIVGEKNGQSAAVRSPFEKTLGFVLWNEARPERIPHVMKYQPFFHSLHISMPNQTAPRQGLNHESLGQDAATITFTIYRQVALTMQVILDSQPDVSGLFYFHFDSWIDPLAWSDINLEQLHFPAFTDKTKRPFTVCMKDTAKQEWWGWEKGIHKKALEAVSAAKSSVLTRNYTINDGEWCLGWSDIYYIPRRFFADFIRLARVFSDPRFDVFHEVAIPTIVHIIDNSRRESPDRPVVDGISDCWGDCCSSNPSVGDVLGHRCGHRLDYRNETVTDAFFAKLASEASLLKKYQ
ncbi:Nucleotide-sugar transporter [Metarhizium album ARSEF 1941]|uniref:Nucleotide-sugar transporter n=1 Tax=Metarhizium album (strain ARSEF 1941) TaxID=1081103 RepID=A0A0B2WVU9_METAS|nr:Nucleotide-sugar transporter [Metarhizium album ARSEF 1941]KHO00247.1 Nucleotide-sugar transporter [Metarhizium album ARSEF 1941]